MSIASAPINMGIRLISARLRRMWGRRNRPPRDCSTTTAGLALPDPVRRTVCGAIGSGQIKRAVDADLVVDRARDLHTQVFLLPGPPAGDRRLVADQCIRF